MNSENSEQDNFDLNTAISVDRDHIDNLIKKICTLEDKKLTCDFYLIRCKKDKIRTNDFLRGIRDLIVTYSLNKGEIPDNISATDIPSIWSKARSRFVSSDKSGEPGELVLFALLETQRNAPQLLNKMALKTSGELHYQGLDGIHIGIVDDEVRLYYGEAKLYNNRSSAISEAIKRLEKFHMSLKEEEFELNLVSSNIDPKKFGNSVESIMEVLNPYVRDKSYLRKVYIAFIGFDWNKLIELDGTDHLENSLSKLIEEESGDILKECKRKFMESELNNSHMEFFFLPFDSVDDFRQKFQESLK